MKILVTLGLVVLVCSWVGCTGSDQGGTPAQSPTSGGGGNKPAVGGGPTTGKTAVDSPTDQELVFNFPSVGLTATVTPQTVVSKKHSSFKIRFWPSNAVKVGAPVALNYSVDGRTWMDMDNGAHHPGGKGKIEMVNPGEYDWTRVGFTMPSRDGVWKIFLSLSQGDQLIEEIGHTIDVP